MAARGPAVKAACGLAPPGPIYSAMTDSITGAAKDAKKERLAAALRANLRRRKAHGRAPEEQAPPPPPTAED